MDVYWLALVAAISVFVWALVRVALVADRPADSSPAGWRPELGAGLSTYAPERRSMAADRRATRPEPQRAAAERIPEPVVWLLAEGDGAPTCLQDEIHRLHCRGLVRAYRRLLPQPSEVDHRA